MSVVARVIIFLCCLTTMKSCLPWLHLNLIRCLCWMLVYLPKAKVHSQQLIRNIFLIFHQTHCQDHQSYHHLQMLGFHPWGKIFPQNSHMSLTKFIYETGLIVRVSSNENLSWKFWEQAAWQKEKFSGRLATTDTQERLFANSCKMELYIVLEGSEFVFAFVYKQKWMIFLQGGAKDPFRYVAADLNDGSGNVRITFMQSCESASWPLIASSTNSIHRQKIGQSGTQNSRASVGSSKTSHGARN